MPALLIPGWLMLGAAALVALPALTRFLLRVLPDCLRLLRQFRLDKEKAWQRQARLQALGRRLSDCRAQSGLPLEDVAEALSISPRQVEKWEQGQASPTAVQLTALSRLYGLPEELSFRDSP